MSYQTDERLKSYLDTNQLGREQLCRSVLALDRRFSEVRPRHPRGGPDGGRDIDAVFRQTQRTFCAVGFVNQANDSAQEKKAIRKKFQADLKSALDAETKPEVFVFLTNINLTVREKSALTKQATKAGLQHAEVMDRERIRITLDSPDGFAARFQYLDISLSEEDASFFAKWGDDIQSVVTTGFQRVEGTLDRLLFLQEASNVLSSLVIVFELDKSYPATEIGHFRAFCYMTLKGPKHKIFAILFGSSDKQDRLRDDIPSAKKRDEPGGIKFGISGGQWEQYLDLDSLPSRDREAKPGQDDNLKLVSTGSSSRIGIDPVENVIIRYNHDSFIRFEPRLNLRDLDQAMFLPMLNESLATRVAAIHAFASGYKLLQINQDDMEIDRTEFDAGVPVQFTQEEEADPWIRIRPKQASAFRLSFFDETPRRMSTPSKTEHDLCIGHN